MYYVCIRQFSHLQFAAFRIESLNSQSHCLVSLQHALRNAGGAGGGGAAAAPAAAAAAAAAAGGARRRRSGGLYY